MTCTTCTRAALCGWTDGEAHEQCVYCACGLSTFRYTPTTGEARRTTWTADDKRAYHRAYMRWWRRRQEVLYGR